MGFEWDEGAEGSGVVGGEREGRFEDIVEDGEGVPGASRVLSLLGWLSLDLSLWLRALFMKVGKIRW